MVSVRAFSIPARDAGCLVSGPRDLLRIHISSKSFEAWPKERAVHPFISLSIDQRVVT
jgi:hypothetical protein